MLAAEMQKNEGNSKLWCLVLKESSIYLVDDKTEGQMSENISGLAVTMG